MRLPKASADFLDSLRKQLSAHTNLLKISQLTVGFFLPILESIVVNFATNSSSNSYWVLLCIIILIHSFLLFAILAMESPLPEVLVEFDGLKQRLDILEQDREKLLMYSKTNEIALFLITMNLFYLLKPTWKSYKISAVFKEILTPWIKNKEAIFWFQNNSDKYNFAVYLVDPNNPSLLLISFRDCHEDIKRKNRQWSIGEGNVGQCFQIGKTVFSDDISLVQENVRPENVRPEDKDYYCSVIASPIKIDDTTQGVFIITSSKTSQFDKLKHSPIVEIIASDLAMALKISKSKGSVN